LDAAGDLYVSDSGNNAIKKILLTTPVTLTSFSVE
jgi:hypothetical protein